MNKSLFNVLAIMAIFTMMLMAVPIQRAQAVSNDIVISQVYGGGGNSGATYTHDFIELFNRGTTTIPLVGWSVQYASATGTTWQKTDLSGTLQPGQYYLIQQAQGSGGTTPLPIPDASGSIAMSATNGKVVVASTTTLLSGSAPSDASIVDAVGYGTANYFEGNPAPGLSNTTADVRAANGCIDTDNNAADFTAGTPAPRNTAAPLNPCVTAADPKINEFSASTVGTDVEYVEIIGSPNSDYSAYTVLEIEGDGAPGAGTVDEVISLGTTGANGLYLVNLPANALENGSVSLLLVKNFTGALGNDLDTNDDGTFDAPPWSALVDSVAVNDGGGADRTYGAPTLGVSYDGLPFAPGGASRIPDGFDTDSATDWVRNDFDLAGIVGFTGTPDIGEAYNTPGATNKPILPRVVINEIDYDQPGTDTAEFIEIRNNGSSAVSLSGLTLELVNGNGGGAAIYDTISLPAVNLAPVDYFVVCANAATVANCDLDDDPDTNFLQNGAPDAIGLRWNGHLIDAVSYEGDTGAPYTEGSGFGLEDPGTTGSDGLGISRCPDGSDTNVNNVDFTLTGITPGAANDCASLTPQLTITDVSLNEGNSGTTSFDFTVNLSVPVLSGGVTFDITTSDNTATAANNDYTAKSLTGQSIPAGGTSYTFSVLVNGDTSPESDETFFVNVTNVTGATVIDAQGLGTIVNDDGLATTFIHDIQGSGSAVTGPGPFTVEAIVVGDYQTQGSGQLRGFFLQEEDADADADPATSEGIFVFCSGCPTAVSVGDKVRVTGGASEFFDMSQLSATTAASVTVVSSGNPLPTPASVTLPVPSVPTGDLATATAFINAYFEKFEGMLVTYPGTLTVSEYFELARFGQVILSAGGRPRQFTDANPPTVAGYINHQIDLASRTIILDDTDNRQNRPVDTPNTAYYHPVPGLSISNFFRGGDTITNLTGVLHWSFNGLSGEDAWRIRPVTEAYSYAFTPVNARPAAPEVEGSLKVASFNVLNYFLTVDTTASNDVGTCGPSGTQDCRGADSAQELQRQRTKMLAALSAIDADVFGFMEMENTPNVEPLADIVAGLSGYDYIDTGVIGGDAIRVGIIYKSTTVQPVGNYAILDSSVDTRFDDTRNRPALAQTFEEITNGARFTVVVNHLKSKGSGCGSGDDDTTTGQGNCNGTRTLAAQGLADWLATDPTGSGDSDVLIIGDLNSYAKEDPIAALQTAGYTDMVAAFGGANAYGYVFDGQLGYLDHALSNATLTPQVKGVAEWHINADEIPLFDYNDDVRDTGESSFEEESDTLPLYEASEFRTSDHDPVIIGLNLNAPPTVDAGGPYSVNEGSSVTLSATGSDPNGDTLTYAWDLDNNGSFETSGQSVSFDASLLDGPSGPYTVKVQATDPGGLTATDTSTVDVLNADPTVSADPASQSVQYSDPIADVTITGVDASADIPLFISSASWNVNGGSSFPGLPHGLTLYYGTCGSNTCTWTLSGTALLTPGTYVVRVTVADKDGGSSTTDITITVAQEDARATYTGALYVSTESTSSSNASVTLAATVQDISVTPDAAGDTYPGDIRNASVTFIDRDTNIPISGCTDLPVGLVNPGDLQTGTVTCLWSVTISGDAQDFTVGIVVNNYYTRNASDDNVVVMVAKPLASNFISGGGYIVLSDSAGQIAGDEGRKSNFGFNVKYNKKGTNLQGHVNIILRRLEADGIVHVYQIKGNVMASLAVQVNQGTATFNGKANIQDITDPLNPISIDGNATLQIDIDDNGEPGSNDTIGITLWNKAGGLWFASKWNGTQTVQQNLNGGNLVVR